MRFQTNAMRLSSQAVDIEDRERKRDGGGDDSVDSNCRGGSGMDYCRNTCKACLENGREAIDRDLNPDYNPDDAADHTIYTPLNPDPPANSEPSNDASASSTITKAV